MFRRLCIPLVVTICAQFFIAVDGTSWTTFENCTTSDCYITQSNTCLNDNSCGLDEALQLVYPSDCNASCANGLTTVLLLFNQTGCNGNCYDGRREIVYECSTNNCTLKEIKRCYNHLTCTGKILTVNGPCSVSCGSGKRNVTDHCKDVIDNSNSYNCAGFDGKPTKVRLEDCNTQPCPTWSTWGSASKCSKSCGSGTQRYLRECMYEGSNSPGLCKTGSANRSESCNTHDCPSWSTWASYGSCSRTCGTGSQSYIRECRYQGSSSNSSLCPGQDNNTTKCNTPNCPTWSSWKTLGSCSRSCGTGQQRYTRVCNYLGLTQDLCTGSSSKTENCNTTPCPSLWSSWSAWSTCDATNALRNGKITRNRTCYSGLVYGRCDGNTEPNLVKELEHQDCTWCQTQIEKCSGVSPCDHWSSWTTDHCGTNKETRRRFCIGVWKPDLLNIHCDMSDYIKAAPPELSTDSGGLVAGVILASIAVIVILLLLARCKGYLIIEMKLNNSKNKTENSRVNEHRKPPKPNPYATQDGNASKHIHVEDEFSSDGSSTQPANGTKNTGYENIGLSRKLPSSSSERVPRPGSMDADGYVKPNLLLSNNLYEDATAKPVFIQPITSPGLQNEVLYDTIIMQTVVSEGNKKTTGKPTPPTKPNNASPKKHYVNIQTKAESPKRDNNNQKKPPIMPQVKPQPKPLSPKPKNLPTGGGNIKTLAKKLEELKTANSSEDEPNLDASVTNTQSSSTTTSAISSVADTKAKLAQMFNKGIDDQSVNNQNSKPATSPTRQAGKFKQPAIMPPVKRM